MGLDDVVRRHRRDLAAAARAVANTSSFDLNLPCALVKDGVVVSTTLNGLRSYLPCSVALASEPITRFLRLKDRVGFDAAFEAMTADDEVGQAFCEAWDEGHNDLANGVVATVDDLVAMVELARAGFADTPRYLLVVSLDGTKVSSCQLACDWVLNGAG